MKTQAMGAVSVLALGATGAYAADPYVPPLDWTGPYAGLNAGVAILDGDVNATTLGFTGTLDLSDTGFTGGGTLGYNWQRDQWVFGIEGDFNFLDVDDSVNFGAAKGTGTVRGDYDWFATIRGRGGIAWGSTFAYATGGVAFIESEIRLTSPLAAGFATATDTDVLVGFAVGGGVEHSFSAQWSGKVEYLYMNFESHSVSVVGPPAGAARAEPELHVIRAGLNYHFCTGGPVFGTC